MPQTFFRCFLPVFLLLPLYSVFADNATSAMRFGYTELFPVHAVLMSLSFALLLTGMIVSGFFKKKRWWLKAHRCLQWTGGISGIAGLATAVYMVSVSTGVHFRLPHSMSGLVGTVLIIATLALGLAIFKAKKEKKKTIQNPAPLDRTDRSRFDGGCNYSGAYNKQESSEFPYEGADNSTLITLHNFYFSINLPHSMALSKVNILKTPSNIFEFDKSSLPGGSEHKV